MPFGSRYSTAPDAPLFHSALQEFREEDSYDEHQRMAADFVALQQSRRAFGASRIGEESESESGSDDSVSAPQDRIEDGERGRGIRSSWRGKGRLTDNGKGKGPEVINEDDDEDTPKHGSKKANDWRKNKRVPAPSEHSSRDHGGMEDVKLASTVADDSEPPDDLFNETLPTYESNPPEAQHFRYDPSPINLSNSKRRVEDVEAGMSQRLSTEIATPLAATLGEPPRHDSFYGSLFLLGIGAMLATFFLIMLHTEAPTGKLPDTIYSSLYSSYFMLAVDTVGAVFVALLWFALLRSFARPLVYLMLIAVPVIMFSFSMLSLTASYKGSVRTSIQDKAMRWLSLIPLTLSFVWGYTIWKGRHSITKATGILEFSTKILAANPALLPMGIVTLVSVVSFTWLWLVMFTRVFLGGHLARSGSIFVVDGVTWWLGVFFIIMYVWSISVINGIQRATTGATVSQWYFHRGQFPTLSSQDTVQSAFFHATTTLFGTICLATLLALLIRLPLLILPRKVNRMVQAIAYNFVPNSIMALTNPLTLTYAAIHSQPLEASAQGISAMHFLSASVPTTTLTPRTFSARSRGHTSLAAYNLAKLILHATRYIMAASLGLGGWVAAARQLSVGADSSLKGSAYAYVVGLVAGFIGWNVLGAMEGVLSGIVDSAVVCYGSENGGRAQGGFYCMEAAQLFGEDGGRGF